MRRRDRRILSLPQLGQFIEKRIAMSTFARAWFQIFKYRGRVETCLKNA